MNTQLAFISVLLLTGVILTACGPSQAELNATATQDAANEFFTQTAAAPTVTPTFTPTVTPTPTLTPEPTLTTGIYESELGVSFAYPNGWLVWEPSEGFITIASGENLQPMQETYAKGEIVMEIIGIPPDVHASGDPIVILNQYTNFMVIDMPDKEPAHIIKFNGKEFLIGTYSENYIKTSRGNRAPLFIAVYFTEQNSFLADMYASPKDEVQLRKVFEDLLVSMQVMPTPK